MASQGDIQNVIDQTNQYIDQYAVNAFSQQRLRTILLNMLNIQSALLGTVAFSTTASLTVTSANFIDATNCPLTAYANTPITSVYWLDTQKMLDPATEWTLLSGGGFQILIPNFNSAQGNFKFTIWA